MIDEARIIATHGGVDDCVFVDDEQEGVIVVDVVIVIAIVRRLVREALPEIFDDPRALRNEGSR